MIVIPPKEIQLDGKTRAILKQMWELNNKRVSDRLTKEEKDYYNTNLSFIKDYYSTNSHYWSHQAVYFD